jgi:hypothetical protein
MKHLGGNLMLVVRTSMVSGKVREKDLDITEEQILAYNNGALVQDAFPNLNADDREFLMTGITPDEWDSLWGSEEE